MRWSIIKNLFMINLLYVNPQQVSMKRVKFAAQGKDLQKSIFRTFMLSQLAMMIIFGALFLFTDLTLMPDRYKTTTILFIAFIILQLTTTFFATFYEDNVTPHLKILPIDEKEIFTTKILVLIFQISAPVVTMFILNVYATVQFTGFNILHILIMIIYSCIFLSLIFFSCTLLFSFLAKTKLFRKYKNSMQVIITITSIFLAGGIYGLTSFMPSERVPFNDYKGDFFFNIARYPVSINSILKIFILAIISLCLLFLVNKFVVKNYFTDINNLALKIKPKKINSTDFNLNKIFRRMTLKSFSNGTIVVQNIMGPILVPLFTIGFVINIRGHEYLQQTTEIIPTAIIVSIILATSMHSNGSFTALSISIDYKNYEFLKTMPINMKSYIFGKLNISLVLQLLITSLIYIAYILVLGTSTTFLVVGYITFLVASITYSLQLFTKDVTIPFTGWSNITQLLMRGASNMKQWLIFLGFFIASILIVFLTVMFTNFFPHLWWALSTFFVLCLLAWTSFVVYKFNKFVLKNLD